MRKRQIGILGATRGMNYALDGLFGHPEAELAVICDVDSRQLQRVSDKLNAAGITGIRYCQHESELYSSDCEGVIIANYANRHADSAIAALEQGKHVLSEVQPVQNLAEAVRLCDTVERSGKIYHYAENNCFSEATLESRRQFHSSEYGALVEADGDFINDCSGRWHLLTRGQRMHWRNFVPSTFYCTHSLGPIFYATGERAVSVTGMEVPRMQYLARHGARSGSASCFNMQLSGGAIARNIMGNYKHPYRSACRLICEKGSLLHSHDKLQLVREEPVGSGTFACSEIQPRSPYWSERYTASKEPQIAYLLDFFLKAMSGERDALAMGIDVYLALDMAIPGMQAYRSILNGGNVMEIPDFRDPSVRERYRNDIACTDPAVAGDQLLPSCSTWQGTVPDAVYEEEATRFEEAMKTQFKLGFY